MIRRTNKIQKYCELEQAKSHTLSLFRIFLDNFSKEPIYYRNIIKWMKRDTAIKATDK